MVAGKLEQKEVVWPQFYIYIKDRRPQSNMMILHSSWYMKSHVNYSTKTIPCLRPFSNYLSYEGHQITLTVNIPVCYSCYLDSRQHQLDADI